MGLYNIARYQVDTYGEAPRLAFSVAPFTATAVPGIPGEEYQTVQLNWAAPEGDIGKIRLLRSQDGYPETEEDGLIIWEWDALSGTARIDSFTDSPSTTTIPLSSGKYAYYRIWIFRDSTEVWLVAGDAVTIVPKPHDSVTPDGVTLVSTHDKFMDMLPRVFTSASQSPLDVVDKTSTLYNFLKGFSFTLDEIITLAENVLPEESGASINPELIVLKALNLGLEPEAYIATKSQKRLVREAVYMYTNKGTKNAIETYAESLTNFAPVITPSPNLLLSVQDSSFYKGLGNWTVAGNGTIALEQTVVPVQDEDAPYAVDYAYTAKVDTLASNVAIRNGLINPRLLGMPTLAGTQYALSANFLTNKTGGNTITPKVHWYNYSGVKVAESTGTAIAVPAGAWTTVSFTASAPGEATDVTAVEVIANEVILTVASSAGFTTGDSITVENVAIEVDGNHVVTATGPTSIEFTLISENEVNIDETVVEGTVRNTLPEGFAGIEFIIGSAGSGADATYVDMVQFADSTVTEYYEARAIDIFLNPSKTNELLNPAFDPTNTTAWDITSASSSYEDGYLRVGTTVDGLTSIASETGVIEGGKYYTFSIFGRMEGIQIVDGEISDGIATINMSASPSWSVGEQITISDFAGQDNFSPFNGDWEILTISGTVITMAINYPDQAVVSADADARICRPETLRLKFNSYNTEIADPVDSVADVHESAPITFTSEWQRYYVTGFVSSSADPIILQVQVYGNTNGCFMDFDSAQVEAAYLPTDYFDGEPPAGLAESARNAVWEGTAHSSRSHLYPNRSIKTLRLAETLRSWLPINRAYTIRTYAGIEHKII